MFRDVPHGIHSTFVLTVFPFSYILSPGAFQTVPWGWRGEKKLSVYYQPREQREAIYKFQWVASNDTRNFMESKSLVEGRLIRVFTTVFDDAHFEGLESEENLSVSGRGRV